MEQDDEDGTAPVHIAAAHGNLEALKFMAEHDVNMEVGAQSTWIRARMASLSYIPV
jgi:ankyrin repeat protein